MIDPELDKVKLLELIRVEYDFVRRTLALMSPQQMEIPDVQGPWSVKDTLAHLTAWERRLLRWYQEADSGQVPAVPEPGKTWADLDEINDRTYREDKDRPLQDVLDDFHAVHAEVVRLVEGQIEDDIFSLGRFEGLFREPPIGLIAHNTYLHFDEHLRPVRAWLARL